MIQLLCFLNINPAFMPKGITSKVHIVSIWQFPLRHMNVGEVFLHCHTSQYAQQLLQYLCLYYQA